MAIHYGNWNFSVNESKNGLQCCAVIGSLSSLEFDSLIYNVLLYKNCNVSLLFSGKRRRI